MELRDRNKIKKPLWRPLLTTIAIPQSYEQALESPESNEWIKAIENEKKSIDSNKTWELKPRPNGIRTLKSKWVFKLKSNPTIYKARLVVKGFLQKYGIDYEEIFSPVCRYESIRLLLSIKASEDLLAKQFDIKTVDYFNMLLNY